MVHPAEVAAGLRLRRRAAGPPVLAAPSAVSTTSTPTSKARTPTPSSTPPQVTPTSSMRESHAKAQGPAMTLTMNSTSVEEEDPEPTDDTSIEPTSSSSSAVSSPSRSGGASTAFTSISIIPTAQPSAPHSSPVPGMPAEPDSQPSKSTMPFSTAVMAGIIAGGVVLVLLLGGCCWVLGRRRRRRAKELAAAGSGRSRSLSRSRNRAGYARSAEPPHSPLSPLSPGGPRDPRDRLAPPSRPSRSGLSRAEARASVQLPYPPQAHHAHHAEILAAPSRAFGYSADDAATSTSAWTDNSEMDVFAVDGSTIARTLSTISRPNSEYDLDDAGATWAGGAYPNAGSYVNFGEGSYMSHDGSRSQGTYTAHSSPNRAFRGPNVVSPVEAYNPYAPSDAPSSQFTSPTGTYTGLVQHAQHGQRAPQHMVSAPSQRQLAGPSHRIPAPRLLIDTKAPLTDDGGMPLSAMSRGTTPGPSAGPSGTWGPQTPTLRTPLDRAPSAASRAMTPDWPYAVRSAAPSPAPPVRSTSRSAADRPTALPYANANANQAQSSPSSPHRPSLRRGPTIIRHADAGIAFEDAVPDGEENGELHLPPAYGDIYGPPQ